MLSICLLDALSTTFMYAIKLEYGMSIYTKQHNTIQITNVIKYKMVRKLKIKQIT